MSLKSLMTCNICKLVLSSSTISLPCLHAIFCEHLQDDTIKNGSIQCLDCEKEFDVPQNRFPSHKMASNIQAENMHLSDKEKQLEQSIKDTIQQLKELSTGLKEKHSNLEIITFDHFSEVKRQIDIQRERLTNKNDELQAKLLDFDHFIEDIQSIGFEAVPDIQIESFGQSILNDLKTKSRVACAIGNTIQIWNLDPIGYVNISHTKACKNLFFPEKACKNPFLGKKFVKIHNFYIATKFYKFLQKFFSR